MQNVENICTLFISLPWSSLYHTLERKIHQFTFVDRIILFFLLRGGGDVVRHPLYIIERFLKVVRILVVSHLDSSGHNGKTTVVCNGLLTEKMISALTLPHIKHGYHSSGANLFQGDG